MSGTEEHCDGGGQVHLGGRSSPVVGILFGHYSPFKLAEALKNLRPGIRMEIVLTGMDGLTEAERETLQSLDVILAQPILVRNFQLTYDLPNLKWMHALTAGVDKIMNTRKPDQPFPSYILTRNGNYFDHQMAEYVIGFVISRERLIAEMRENQEKRFWDSWSDISYRMRQMSDLSIGICGFGHIGQKVARLAKAFGMKIVALVRTIPDEDQQNPDVDEYKGTSDISDLLSACDYIVSILPATPQTDGIFDGDVLSNCKTKKPVFMNIGRGNVVSESTIIRALDDGWISHAVLDVFETEPLPTSSSLWSHPQVTVTPHTSGSSIREESFLKTFLENYDRFIRGENLIHTVDWKRGY